MNKLTPKQQLFVEHYLNDNNAHQAALRAGYSANAANRTASRLLKNPAVKASIETQQQETLNQLKIKRTDKLKKLWQIVEESCELKRFTTTIAAIAEMNKMQGHYAPDKQEIKQDVKQTLELSEIQVEILEAAKEEY